MRINIGYLGPVGTHSHTAAERVAKTILSPTEIWGTVPMMSFTHIFEAVEEGAVQLGCVVIENALEGSVGEVLDYMATHQRHTVILAEFVRPVQHALIRQYPVLEGIKVIHSHPQAIGQCREAVYKLLGRDVKFVPSLSTSEAVKTLANVDETHAALGSIHAAAHYGFDIVVENIGDIEHNATRFLLVGRPDILAACTGLTLGDYSVKTSLCIGIHENRSGALLTILEKLAAHQLNMSKIESRPTKKSLGEYQFYIDIEGPVPESVMNPLIAETSFLKCLGVYPVLGVLD